MASEFKRPTCESCWFAKVDDEELIIQCNRDPAVVEKSSDDFCRHHPAWSEFESRAQDSVLSELYERQSP